MMGDITQLASGFGDSATGMGMELFLGGGVIAECERDCLLGHADLLGDLRLGNTHIYI